MHTSTLSIQTQLMTSYRLPKDKLPDFLSALSDFEVWAPVKKGTATLFDRLDDVTAVSLDLENQPVISKKAVFPQNEPLFSYDRKGTVTEADLDCRQRHHRFRHTSL